MGYGDIVPVTDVERIFTLGVALIGAVVFSYCMGSVATLISQVGRRRRLFSRGLSILVGNGANQSSGTVSTVPLEQCWL